MKSVYINIVSILLLPVSLFLNYIASKYPNIIESLYSNGINKSTIEILSFITGFIPFSMYDIFVVILILSGMIYIFTTIKRCMLNKKSTFNIISKFILNVLSLFSVLYFLFIILWGINYNRIPFNESIGIEISKHSESDLSNLYELLINKCNSIRDTLPEDKNGVITIESGYKSIFERSKKGYDSIEKNYPTLQGNYSKPKYILSSEIFNYTGITGIYFPFTGQANVNINAPIMTIPSTTMHEMAHQRGYAHEDEANFIAYLSCINHPDLAFKYSGYLLALSHTSNALYKENIDILKKLNSKLSNNVRADIIYQNEFWEKYDGKINEFSNKINDSYLKSNGVEDGDKSYGRMVDLLLSYYDKFPY